MEFSVAGLCDEGGEERKNGMEIECVQANNALFYFCCEMQLMGRNAFGPKGGLTGRERGFSGQIAIDIEFGDVEQRVT